MPEFCWHALSRFREIMRLENGRFQWPMNEEQVRMITDREFRWLMEGLAIDQPKAVQKTTIKRAL